MCEFCEYNIENFFERRDFQRDTFMWVEGSQIKLESHDLIYGESIYESAKIKFCPMCGRKLT